MLTRSTALAMLVLSSCASTAPHALGAAAINSALATGAAAGSVASGGCYATCTHGTTCNRRTGLCDRTVAETSVEPASRATNRMTLQLQQSGHAATPGTLGIGISPATGSTPPPPAEASPRAP